MESDFVFSIVMPIYNTEEYIRQSIDSVMSQTLDFKSNVQLILVNDGSTDNSLEIALEYHKRFPENIEVISQENQGLGAARNTGLEHVRGKYVNFLDPDDYISENTLKEVKEFFDENGDSVDLVSIKVMEFERVNRPHILNFKFTDDRIIDLTLEADNPQLAVNSSFIKYEAFRDLRFRTDLVSSEDTNLTCKVLLEKKAFGVLKSPSYFYRKRKDSSSLVDTSISKKGFFTYRLKNHFMDVINYCLEKEGEVPLFIQYTLAYSIQWMVTREIPEFFTTSEKEEFINCFKKVLSYLSIEALSSKKLIRNVYLRNYLISIYNRDLHEALEDGNVLMKSSDVVLDSLSGHKIHAKSIEKKNGFIYITASFSSMFDSKNLIFTASAEYGGDVKTFSPKRRSCDALCYFSTPVQYINRLDFEIPLREDIAGIKINADYESDEGIISSYPGIALDDDTGQFQIKDDSIILKEDNMISMIGNDWDLLLKDEFKKDYFVKLMDFVDGEYRTKTVYPPYEDIFNAFSLTPPDKVKVIILGQDPYHEEGQAHGLAFSTPEGRPIPRSLKNIFKEIKSEYSYPIPESGSLVKWAKQGVFLLNTVLTVEKGNANSHSKCGWQTFTDRVIEILDSQNHPIVFMLWGKQAEKKSELISNPNHLVLITSHPSPFSARRGFFGSNHFALANEFLKQNGEDEIDWRL